MHIDTAITSIENHTISALKPICNVNSEKSTYNNYLHISYTQEWIQDFLGGGLAKGEAIMKGREVSPFSLEENWKSDHA